MASTYSQLKIELIGSGDQAGTWGNTTNVNLGTAIEEAITGSANVTFASSNVAIALTDSNLTQTARNLRLNLVGTITNIQTLFIPAIEKQYIISNTLSNSVRISNGSNASPTGTAFTIPAGRTSIVFNDGTNINDVVTYVSSLANLSISGASINNSTSNASTFSNVSIISGNINNITSNASTFTNVTITTATITANAATLTNAVITTATVNGGTSNGVSSSNVIINSGTVGNVTINAYTEGITTGYVNTGAAYTINIANTTIITANLSASCTFTMPTATAGKSFILLLKTGAGSFTGTFTGVKFVGNTAPTITTTANRMDILTFTADGTNWYGNYAQNYNPN